MRPLDRWAASARIRSLLLALFLSLIFVCGWWGWPCGLAGSLHSGGWGDGIFLTPYKRVAVAVRIGSGRARHCMAGQACLIHRLYGGFLLASIFSSFSSFLFIVDFSFGCVGASSVISGDFQCYVPFFAIGLP